MQCNTYLWLYINLGKITLFLSFLLKLFCVLKPHLFRFTADRTQHERVQDVFPSQKESIAVLIQKDGTKWELAIVPTEDGWPVGGDQVCRKKNQNGEQWNSDTFVCEGITLYFRFHGFWYLLWVVVRKQPNWNSQVIKMYFTNFFNT